MGCGWLGKPLAETLLYQGYSVKGTTTHVSKLEELKVLGIDPYKVELKETSLHGQVDEFLEGLDVLVVNIPPGLRSNKQSDYPGRIELLLDAIAKHSAICHLIYVSSTSVFEEMEEIPVYNESSTPNATDSKGKKLIAAEKKIQKFADKSTMIRPGGLIGGDRHPIKMLAGRKGVNNPEAPINLTDRAYLIEVILKVISREITAPMIHAISEPHESRKTYYTKKAHEFDLEPPVFDGGKSLGKKIVSAIL